MSFCIHRKHATPALVIVLTLIVGSIARAEDGQKSDFIQRYEILCDSALEDMLATAVTAREQLDSNFIEAISELGSRYNHCGTELLFIVWENAKADIGDYHGNQILFWNGQLDVVSFLLTNLDRLEDVGERLLRLALNSESTDNARSYTRAGKALINASTQLEGRAKIWHDRYLALAMEYNLDSQSDTSRRKH